jgi:hypothetical protein
MEEMKENVNSNMEIRWGGVEWREDVMWTIEFFNNMEP